jgi:hypothetical protein
MVQTKDVEQNKAHILCSKTFFPKIVPFMRKFGKTLSRQTGHRWQYNMAHALYLLDNLGYKHKLGMYNTYNFPTATMV